MPLRKYYNSLSMFIDNKLNVIRSFPLIEKYNSKNSLLKYSIIILLIFNFVLLAVDGINMILNPQWFDTTGYLGEANFISHHGGIINFLNLCFSGTYKQANQHPLYILLLTPFASINLSFFIAAKIISAVVGLIMLMVLFVLGKKMYGNLVASVTVFALLLNGVFLVWTSGVACESLLMLVSLLCIYFVMAGFKNNKYWLYAGIFAGLSYLAKGTGILLLPGFVLAAFIIYKLSIFKNKYFWLFFVLFALVASPLIIRNIIVYQTPFYNVNNNIINMGQDKIDTDVYVTFDLKDGVANWKYEKNETDVSDKTKSENPRLKFFLNIISHPKKIIDGARAFLDTWNISWAQKLPSKLPSLVILLLVLLFFTGIVRDKNSGGKIYFLITILVFFAALFTMPIDRYFLPLIPFIWIYIALGIFTFLDIINKSIIQKRYKFDILSYIPLFLTLCLLLYAGFIITKKDLKNPLHSVEYSESRSDILNWLRANLKKGDLYTMGPNFNWQLEKGTWILPPRIDYGDFSKFKLFVKEHHVSYIIVDLNTLKDFANKFDAMGQEVANQKKDIEDYFVYDSVQGIIEKKRIDGWNLVYAEQKKPTDFLIYTLTDK